MNTPPYIYESDGAVRPGQNVKPGARLPIDLDERELSFIRIDHQTRLQFGRSEVQIGTAFTLSSPTGDLVLDEPADLGPLLALYPDTVTDVFADSDCALHLKFGSGASIFVAQDDQYEAWQIRGPGTALVVCPPTGSGGLAIWR